MTKLSSKANTIPTGIFKGIAAAHSVVWSTSFLFAFLIKQRLLPFESVGYLYLAILFAAGFLGNWLAIGLVHTIPIQIGWITTLSFWASLLAVCALLFHGSLPPLLSTLCPCIMGGIAAVILHTKKQSKPKFQKGRKHYGKYNLPKGIK